MAATSTAGGGGDTGGGLAAGEMEVEAYRRLFPLAFYERHLRDSVRPDARPLHRARDTSIALGYPLSLLLCSTTMYCALTNSVFLSSRKALLLLPTVPPWLRLAIRCAFSFFFPYCFLVVCLWFLFHVYCQFDEMFLLFCRQCWQLSNLKL